MNELKLHDPNVSSWRTHLPYMLRLRRNEHFQLVIDLMVDVNVRWFSLELLEDDRQIGELRNGTASHRYTMRSSQQHRTPQSAISHAYSNESQLKLGHILRVSSIWACQRRWWFQISLRDTSAHLGPFMQCHLRLNAPRWMWFDHIGKWIDFISVCCRCSCGTSDGAQRLYRALKIGHSNISAHEFHNLQNKHSRKILSSSRQTVTTVDVRV